MRQALLLLPLLLLLAAGSAGAAQAGQIPMIACPTEDAAHLPVHTLPAGVSSALPAAIAGRLAFYSDRAALMVALAPRGWGCSALIGADGSSRLSVHAPGQTHEIVQGSQTSACYGCTTGQACALFAAAAAANSKAYGACPASRPPQERVHRISATAVGFEDPPGIVGDAAHSGGRYPAHGVMTYIPRSNDGSWTESCVLPPSEHALCTAILNDFLRRYADR